MPIRGSKSVLIAGRSSLYVAKRALCAFLSIWHLYHGFQYEILIEFIRLQQTNRNSNDQFVDFLLGLANS